jgi:hypothetical protein
MLAWRTLYLGGESFCILEEVIRPWTIHGSLDSCMKAWSWLNDAWVEKMFMQGQCTQWSTCIRRLDGDFGGL